MLKRLDIVNFNAIILITMNKNDDGRLIKKFINWCIDNNFNQVKMAELAKRTPAWASLLVEGKIKSLNFDTRNQLKRILGEL